MCIVKKIKNPKNQNQKPKKIKKIKKKVCSRKIPRRHAKVYKNWSAGWCAQFCKCGTLGSDGVCLSPLEVLPPLEMVHGVACVLVMALVVV
jgi:hypothetical protein